MSEQKKIKVLRIINRLNLGGPTYNVAYLTKYLEPEFETKLVAGMKDDSEASSEHIIQSLHIEPTYVKDMHRSIHPIKDFLSFIEIRRIIKEYKPDIVHTHAAKSGAIGRFAALSCKVPIILHTFHGHVFHSYFSSLSTKVFLWIERFLARRTQGIIAISNLQKKELCEDFQIVSPDKAYVIPLGFDLSKFSTDIDVKRKAFRDQYGVKDDEVVISIIGRLVPIKNHSFFLKSIQLVKEKSAIKTRVFIAGDGELRSQIEAEAKSLGLSFDNEDLAAPTDLTFTSWIKEVDVVNAGSDIICLSSLNEGTPVSLIEACASGRPIVSTNVGGIGDFIEHTKNGFLVDDNNPNTFANHLLYLINHEKERIKMGLFNQENIKQLFSYTRLINDVKSLYFKLLSNK